MHRCKRRGINFSQKEVETLIEAVNKRLSVINGSVKSNGSESSPLRKKEAWEAVTAEVFAVGGLDRSVDEIKKKWANVRHTSRKKSGYYLSESYKNRRKDSECKQDKLNNISDDDVEELDEDDVNIVGNDGRPNHHNGCFTPNGNVDIKSECGLEDSTSSEGIINETILDVDAVGSNSVAYETDESEPPIKKPKTSETEMIGLLKNLVRVEEERCQIEKQRLEIEKERLEMERIRMNKLSYLV